ncbi:MAG: hypothetical protein AVDCRST_MAG88-3918, partial [uncultured Thermomicrobiales bacterium]
NSNNARMDNVLGAAGPAPIWHNFMVEVHQRPELARHLLDPDGQPYPTEFARPPGIVEADVCPATGKRAGGPVAREGAPGTPAPQPVAAGGRKGVFKHDHPVEPCDQITPEESLELDLALRSVSRDAGKFAPGTTQSVLAYRAAARNYRPQFAPPPGPTVAPPPPRR